MIKIKIIGEWPIKSKTKNKKKNNHSMYRCRCLENETQFLINMIIVHFVYKIKIFKFLF